MFKIKYPLPRSSPQRGEEVITIKSSLSLGGEGKGEGGMK
jgi:hypothetical protein